MSKIDSIEKPQTTENRFHAIYERLQVVDSVMQIVADMTVCDSSDQLALPDQDKMHLAFEGGSPMLRRRCDRISQDMANMARSGAQSLLHMKSGGRPHVQFAARRLIQEIAMANRKLAGLLNI